jgi:hypothetical protein
MLSSVEARDFADEPLQSQHEVVRALISVLLLQYIKTLYS